MVICATVIWVIRDNGARKNMHTWVTSEYGINELIRLLGLRVNNCYGLLGLEDK